MKKIIFLCICVFSLIQINAQCSTGINSQVTPNLALSISTKQSFQLSCRGVLSNLVFTPVGDIDDLRGQNYFVGVRLRNASNTIIANATINGAAQTDQWFSGATITANFSAANITLEANTSYTWEVYETTETTPLYLFTQSTSSVYAGGNAFSDNINYPNRDWYGWSLSVTAPVVLPVELLYFSGEVADKATILKWKTASEVNNKGFYVEKSIDAKEFQTIGFINSKENGLLEQEYTYIDVDKSYNTIYYRLRQVDNDENFKYSSIITIYSENVKENITIYPNPSNGIFHIQTNNNSDILSIKILNSLGQMMQVNIQNNQLDLSAFPTGIYYLQNTEQLVKLVKH